MEINRNKYRMISYRIYVVKVGKRTLPNIFDRLYLTARWRCGKALFFLHFFFYPFGVPSWRRQARGTIYRIGSGHLAVKESNKIQNQKFSKNKIKYKMRLRNICFI